MGIEAYNLVLLGLRAAIRRRVNGRTAARHKGYNQYAKCRYRHIEGACAARARFA